jgi:ABC-type amino acid transport substrate-binding protein
MKLRLAFAFACAVTVPAIVCLCAQSPAQVLAPTGTLRVIFLGMNPVQGRFDAQTGKATGPVPEIVEALAKKLGVPLKIIASPNAAGIAKAIDAREADIGVLAYDEERTRDVDYGAPLLVMFNSYLVSKDSMIVRSSDVDRAGVTVAAVRGQTQELWVSSHLKNAKVRVFETMPTVDEVEWLLTSRRSGTPGAVDAFAINRQRSLDAEAESGGRLRALADSFLQVDQSFVVRKGDREKLPLLETFAAEVRMSGLVKASIERAKLTGVDVAK